MKKRKLFICLLLTVLSILYIFIVKNVDVKMIGPNNSFVGLSSINNYVFNLTHVNMSWYDITYILGIIPIFIALIYCFIGLIQLIKNKSLFKVDKNIISLGIFYIIIILLYIFFEIFIVNYRPILMDGKLEASFPSSHTILAICICYSSILVNKFLIDKKDIKKIIDIILYCLIIVIVIGRLISGVHWFTDILGGIIISIALINWFNYVLDLLNKKI